MRSSVASIPIIAAIWPTLSGESIVLDVGAGIGADAQQLLDFAVMGGAMARALFEIEKPMVGLLNVGVEEIKGQEEVKEAGRLIREAGLDTIDYYGFVEGDDLGKGTVDVVVTEGFAGNIALKTAEGTARQVGSYIRDALKADRIAEWLGKGAQPTDRVARFLSQDEALAGKVKWTQSNNPKKAEPGKKAQERAAERAQREADRAEAEAAAKIEAAEAAARAKEEAAAAAANMTTTPATPDVTGCGSNMRWTACRNSRASRPSPAPTAPLPSPTRRASRRSNRCWRLSAPPASPSPTSSPRTRIWKTSSWP